MTHIMGMGEWRTFYMVGRAVLQVVLLVTFLCFFGLPAIHKFRGRKVVVVRSTRETGGIAAPAVTIFAGTQEPGEHWSAWKQKMEQACSDAGSTRSLENCIDSNSFQISDFLKMAALGCVEMKSLTKQVKEEFAYSDTGRYFTLNEDISIRPNYDKDEIIFILSHSFVYYFHIYDPTFYFGYYNPVFPMARMALVDPNKTVNFYRNLMLTEVEELDLPEDLYNTDPDYNFQACFKRSLSSQVGCRTKWDQCTLAGSYSKGATLSQLLFWLIKEKNLCKQ